MADKRRESDKPTEVGFQSTNTPAQPSSQSRYAMVGSIESESLYPDTPAASATTSTKQPQATIHDQSRTTADSAAISDGEETNYFQDAAAWKIDIEKTLAFMKKHPGDYRDYLSDDPSRVREESADYNPDAPGAAQHASPNKEPFTIKCTMKDILAVKENMAYLFTHLPELWNSPGEEIPIRYALSLLVNVCGPITKIINVPGTSDRLSPQLYQALNVWQKSLNDEMRREFARMRGGSPGHEDKGVQTSGVGRKTERERAEGENEASSSPPSWSSGSSTVRATKSDQQQGGGETEGTETGAIQRRVKGEAAFRRQLADRSRTPRQESVWSTIRNMGNERANAPAGNTDDGASSGKM